MKMPFSQSSIPINMKLGMLMLLGYLRRILGGFCRAIVAYLVKKNNPKNNGLAGYKCTLAINHTSDGQVDGTKGCQ